MSAARAAAGRPAADNHHDDEHFLLYSGEDEQVVVIRGVRLHLPTTKLLWHLDERDAMLPRSPICNNETPCLPP